MKLLLLIISSVVSLCLNYRNTMHSFRNRHSQEIRQSVFHIDDSTDKQKTSSSKTSGKKHNFLTRNNCFILKCSRPPSSLVLVVPTPSSSQSPESSAKAKSEQDLSTISPIRKNSKEKSKSLELKDTSRLQHEKLSLTEEVKVQKVK